MIESQFPKAVVLKSAFLNLHQNPKGMLKQIAGLTPVSILQDWCGA